MKTSTKWLTAAAALLALCAAGCGVSARQEALPEKTALAAAGHAVQEEGAPVVYMTRDISRRASWRSIRPWAGPLREMWA